METESVQEGGQALHENEHAHGEGGPGGEQRPQHHEPEARVRLDAHAQDHLPQDLRQF